MFRNESGNGAKGINNKYCGAEADSGRWPASFTSSFSGTVTIRANDKQRLRIFLACRAMPANLDFFMNRVLSRGLYIGGRTHLVLTLLVCKTGDPLQPGHSMTEANTDTLERIEPPLPFWPADALSETIKPEGAFATDN
jgi:hypothetical protein